MREYGGGLYVTEMVTARASWNANPSRCVFIEHDADEQIRSIQIYGVDAVNVGKAIRLVVEEDRADHIDLNFGCPARKSQNAAAVRRFRGKPIFSLRLCIRRSKKHRVTIFP